MVYTTVLEAVAERIESSSLSAPTKFLWDSSSTIKSAAIDNAEGCGFDTMLPATHN